MRLPRQVPLLRVALGVALTGGCEGAQQGYYDACDEPAGLVLGCEPEDQDEALTAWDACNKLATCGVILAQDDDDSDETQPTLFDDCVIQVQEALEDQGQLVLLCIHEASCPDLAATADVEGMDPNPQNGNIEGVIGYCGRLDPE